MGNWVFDENGWTVTDGLRHAALLPKEFALLRFLYDNRNRAFSRDGLLEQVWPMEHPVDRTVDDHVYRLRRKLAGAPLLDAAPLPIYQSRSPEMPFSCWVDHSRHRPDWPRPALEP